MNKVATKKSVKNVSKKLPFVIVRSRDAGVHFGLLKSRKETIAGTVIVLEKTQRVWFWKGAASLSQMAVSGVTCPNECKFSVVVDENTITNCVEVLKTTKESEKNLRGVPIWKM